MPNSIKIVKGRTNIVTVNLGFDVSADTFRSQIRKSENHTSDILGTFDVDFTTDGTDGRLTLTLDNSDTATIPDNVGYMDIERMSGGEPLNVFKEPLRVEFQDRITA